MNKLKLLAFLFTLAPIAFLAGIGIARANESIEEAIDKYNISFPIAELGSCSGFASCRTFCEDPINRDVCVSYAKKKGFYKEEEINQKKSEIMNSAMNELGCNSENSCKSMCESESNFEKCTEFAKKHGLGGGQMLSPRNQDILSKAKSILGCDSPTSCKSLCENPDNRQKCSEFAKQAGLPGGEQRVGPGGCNSEDTCKAFCSNPANREECQKFGGGPGGEGPGSPGGPPCNSEAECRSYCKDHPDECQGGGPGPPEEEYCQQNPNECQNRGGVRPENMEGFCRENPERCQEGGQFGPGQPPDNQGQRDTQEFQIPDHCRENPQDCPDIRRPDSQERPQEGTQQMPESRPPEEGQGGGVPATNQEPSQVQEPTQEVRGTSTVGSWRNLLDSLIEGINSLLP